MFVQLIQLFNLNISKYFYYLDCSNNYNCDRSEVCREGKCVSACSRERCNLNEGCQITFDHYATCQCLPGFIRDRDGNCVLGKYENKKKQKAN